MTEVFSRDTGHQGGISLTQFDDKSSILEIDRGGSSYAAVSPDVLHALADWIIANVPKPEPTPLPTKFGAVVKSNGFRFMRAAEDAWYRQGGGMCHDEDIRSRGFEIVSEGVDD